MPVINLGGDDSAPADPSNGGQWIQYPDGTWGPPGGGFGPYGGRSTPWYGAPPIPQPTPAPTPGTSLHTTSPGGFDWGSLLGINSAQAGELSPGASKAQPPPPPQTGVTIGGRTAGPSLLSKFFHPFNSGVTASDLGINNPFTHVYHDRPALPSGTPVGALAPGASGIVQGPSGTELMNPGPPINAILPTFTAQARPIAAPVRAPAPTYQAAPAAAAAPQQSYSPFTMVLRPNAPAEGGGRNWGGSNLSTALDLSNWGRGYQPPAPRNVNLGYGISPAATAAVPARVAPVRAAPDMTMQQLRHPWSPFTPGQGTPPSPVRQPYNPFALFGTPT